MAVKPVPDGFNTVSVYLVVKNAVEAGCTVTAPIMDAFWGDRYGKLADPFGHQWGIATHKEDLSDEEMGRRAAEFFSSMGDC